MTITNFPYNYIAIEGNIGSGKTSFVEMVHSETNSKMVLEQFDENPFLPMFYEDPTRYGFTVELFFMTERYKQLQKQLITPDLFNDFIISDFCFVKTLLFARKNLRDEEYKMFQMLFNVLNKNFPNPDLLVYLHRDTEILLKHIRKRNREYEINITAEYLRSIQDSYFEYLRNIISFPVLILDLKNIDFVAYPKHYETIKFLISKKYNPGVHRVALSVDS